MSTIKIKENSIKKFVDERQILPPVSISICGSWTIGDGSVRLPKKCDNKHLHDLLKPEMFFKKDLSIKAGDVVLFELEDILQGSEEIKTVTYTYDVEEYDHYSVRLVKTQN